MYNLKTFKDEYPSLDEIAFRALKEEWFSDGKGLKVSANIYELLLSRCRKFLSELESMAVSLCFVAALTIAQVADCLGMSWDGADELLDRAIKKMVTPLIIESRNKGVRRGIYQPTVLGN